MTIIFAIMKYGIVALVLGMIFRYVVFSRDEKESEK